MRNTSIAESAGRSDASKDSAEHANRTIADAAKHSNKHASKDTVEDTGHAGANRAEGAKHASAAKRKSYRPGGGEAARAFEERTGIKAPRIVAWEITRSCNLACAHCRAAAHCESYPGELSLDECKRVIDDIASITDPILILTGGEPLMREDIWDIIDYAHEKGLHPVIGTNGTLIDDECAARIAQHGIPRVSVSLDFPTAEGQDAFRGKVGAFEDALAGMRNLRAHGVDVQVNTTVTKLNNHLLDEIHEIAQSEGAAAFHPFLLVPTGRGEDLVDVELTPDEYEEVLTWAYNCQKTSPLHFKPTDAPQYYRIVHQQTAAETRDGENHSLNANPVHAIGNHLDRANRPTHATGSHPVNPEHPGHPGHLAHAASNHPSRSGHPSHPSSASLETMSRGCLGGIAFAFISHVGDVQPCGYFDMQLGNVRDEPFSQIWETSPVFDDLRHFNRLRGKCGVCEYKSMCGGCRARALAATGDYLAEEPYCAYVPRKIARQRVLDEIQSGFPLESDPYGVLAQRIGLSRDQVMRSVEALQNDGTIRQICASLSSKKLGYTSTLCALAVPGPDEAIDRAAELVSAHPEVTHNYRRDAEFNVWFTAIAPSTAHLEQLARDVASETGCGIVNLPVTKLHKIRVDFGKHGAVRTSKTETPTQPEKQTPAPTTISKLKRTSNKNASTCSKPASMGDAPAPTGAEPTSVSNAPKPADAMPAPFDANNPFDIALVRWAQADTTIDDAGELIEHPFQHAAQIISTELDDDSVSEERILRRLREWKENGTIRRFGAFVRHLKLGYTFNGMTVWNVPAAEVATIGRAFAALPYVSHCYERTPAPSWPYNLYAMAHAKSQDELDVYVDEMRQIAGIEPRVLVSSKEYKKTLPVFFQNRR